MLPQNNAENSRLRVELLSGDEIEAAQRLLYEVYIEEQGWELEPGNPSGLAVRSSRRGPLLVDEFDATAVWVGVYDGPRLVGTQRMVPRVDGHYEVDLYHEIPRFLETSAVECNRLAVLPAYRMSSVTVMLLTQIFFWCREHGVRHPFGAALIPNPLDIYLKLGLVDSGMPPFKYDAKDRQSVQLVHLDTTNELVLARFTRFARRLAPSLVGEPRRR